MTDDLSLNLSIENLYKKIRTSGCTGYTIDSLNILSRILFERVSANPSIVGFLYEILTQLIFIQTDNLLGYAKWALLEKVVAYLSLKSSLESSKDMTLLNQILQSVQANLEKSKQDTVMPQVTELNEEINSLKKKQAQYEEKLSNFQDILTKTQEKIHQSMLSIGQYISETCVDTETKDILEQSLSIQKDIINLITTEPAYSPIISQSDQNSYSPIISQSDQNCVLSEPIFLPISQKPRKKTNLARSRSLTCLHSGHYNSNDLLEDKEKLNLNSSANLIITKPTPNNKTDQQQICGHTNKTEKPSHCTKEKAEKTKTLKKSKTNLRPGKLDRISTLHTQRQNVRHKSVDYGELLRYRSDNSVPPVDSDISGRLSRRQRQPLQKTPRQVNLTLPNKPREKNRKQNLSPTYDTSSSENPHSNKETESFKKTFLNSFWNTDDILKDRSNSKESFNSVKTTDRRNLKIRKKSLKSTLGENFDILKIRKKSGPLEHKNLETPIIYHIETDTERKIRWKNASESEVRKLCDCFSKIRNWLNYLLNENLPNELDAFYEALKDGTVLCRTANVLKKGSIKRINVVPHMTILASENIESFLSACKELGLSSSELFSIDDLLNAENIPKVFNTLTSLMAIQTTNPFLPEQL